MQAKRTAEAKGVIERLHREFPESRWSRDADTLLAQTRPPVQGDSGLADDERASGGCDWVGTAGGEASCVVLGSVVNQ